MLTPATVRGYGRIDDSTAAGIAELWNAAYPVMRAVATARVDAYRQQIENEAWRIDPDHPRADILRPFLPTEASVRRKLKNAEALRRELGQLDRGTHRACTRATPGFTPFAAYNAVRYLLEATTVNDRSLAAVYRLAAVLAEEADERHRKLEARTAA